MSEQSDYSEQREREHEAASQARGGVTGVGLGLRWDFVEALLEQKPGSLDFLEVSPENYIGRGGYYDEALTQAAVLWPIVTHGLTMSLGGVDPLRAEYIESLAAFVARVKSPWHSEHLCFSTFGGVALHDLLPIPFKHAEVTRVADRIKRVQDAIGVPMAVENVSFYMHPGKPEMTEPEFLTRVCEAADCGLLLDVNNAYVNATNFDNDVDRWMRDIPFDRVVQIHVAGHDWFTENTWALTEPPRDAQADKEGKLIVDTHGAACCDAVLALLERTLAKTGPVPVLLERDQSIPDLPELLAEVANVKAIWNRATGTHRQSVR